MKVLSMLLILALVGCAAPTPQPTPSTTVYHIEFYQQGKCIEYFNTYQQPNLVYENCGSGLICRIYRMEDTEGKTHRIFDAKDVTFTYKQLGP